MLTATLVALLTLVQLAVLFQALYLYYPLVGALLGRVFPIVTAPVPDLVPPRMAVLIAAHNEGAVIAGAIEALKNQTYPCGAYEIFVVADNCTDQTAVIARRAGATVYERFSTGPSTKGKALHWMWSQLRDQGFGAVMIFDGDNHAAPNFLSVMAGELARGHAVIQGIRRAPNTDGPTARLDALTELCTHRIGAAGRIWLGLGAPLMGSGVAYQAPVFDRLIGEVGQTVAEDCQWQATLAVEGTPIHWTADAVVWDEKTATPEAMGTQRTRWMSGRGQVARDFTGPLLKSFFTRGSLLGLDTALYFTAVPRSLLLVSLAGLAFLALAAPGLPGLWSAGVWLAALVGFVFYVLAGLWLDGASRRDYVALVGGVAQLPRFTWQMTQATWKALNGFRARWISTPHGPSEA